MEDLEGEVEEVEEEEGNIEKRWSTWKWRER